MKRSIDRRFKQLILIGSLVGAFSAHAAIPYVDATYTYKQPNGELLRVSLDGNDFYAEQRTDDGALVVYDPIRRGLCYARINAAGDDLESTGVLATNRGVRSMNAAGRQAGLSHEVRKKKALQRRAQLLGTTEPGAQVGALSVAPAGVAPAAVTGTVKGLTVLIDFPDEPSSITRQQVDDYLNGLDYTGFGNAQSVRGYFRSVSGGALDYINHIPTVFYRAAHPKTYYNDESIEAPKRAQELIKEALNWLQASGYDFSTLTVDANRKILGLNFLYAGSKGTSWSKGLWPHMSILPTQFCASGVCAKGYQISDLGTELKIGTFVHESGHLLFGWPDLYDYDGSSYGSVAAFDVMGYGAVTPAAMLRPVPPNGYFRTLAGWTQVVELNRTLNPSAPTGRLSLTSASQQLYRYSNPLNSREAFYIEAIHKSGQNLNQPGQGLAIFHVDPLLGNNNNEWRPLVQMEHADGRRDPENQLNIGESSDLYDGVMRTAFNDTTPNATASTAHGTNALWWSNAKSGFALSNIGMPAPTISFDVGSGGSGGSGGTPQVIQGTLLSGQQLALTPFTKSTSGSITASLSGPAAPANFDLRLERYASFQWQTVASSTGPTAQESLSYAANAGTYRIVLKSVSGSGSYSLTLSK